MSMVQITFTQLSNFIIYIYIYREREREREREMRESYIWCNFIELHIF